MQHPSNPIPDTIEPVPGYPPALKLYRVPCSPFYYARLHISGKRVTRSMKTKNKELARKAAAEFYDELLVKRAKKQPLTTGGQFRRAYEGMLDADEQRVKLGQRKASLVRDGRYIFDQSLGDFFKSDQLKDISYARIQEYIKHIQKTGVGAGTIKNHLMYISKALRHAVQTSQLAQVPMFPKVSKPDNPREWLNNDQYEHLKKVIVSEVKKKTVVRYKPITNELLYLTIFMVNTFLRPSDIKELRHRDITVVKNGVHRLYLKIRAKAKTKVADVISLPRAVDVYVKLVALNGNHPDAFVFFPALTGRAHAQKIMQEQFSHVLNKAGLKTSSDGVPRTLYSLRHTAIMLRLLSGDMSIMLLASNCRTSPDMIYRFYGSHLQAEMAVDELHSLKPGYMHQGPMEKIDGYQSD